MASRGEVRVTFINSVLEICLESEDISAAKMVMQ